MSSAPPSETELRLTCDIACTSRGTLSSARPMELERRALASDGLTDTGGFVGRACEEDYASSDCGLGVAVGLSSRVVARESGGAAGLASPKTPLSFFLVRWAHYMKELFTTLLSENEVWKKRRSFQVWYIGVGIEGGGR